MATYRDRWIAHAIMYVEKFHLSVIPVGRDKIPLIEWQEFQTRLPEPKEIIEWPCENLGVVTGSISNIAVIDCESPADATWFWNNCGHTETVCQTRRGYHFYFQYPGPVKNDCKVQQRYDVRGDGGYVVVPPSEFEGGAYRWHRPLVHTTMLPKFKMEWRPERPKASYVSDRQIRDVIRYTLKIKAISGQGGHNATYKVACYLRESGLSEAEALLALQEWNRTNAEPPWSDRELLHKIRDVYCE